MRSQMAIWRKRLDFVRTRTMGQHVRGFMRPEVAAGRRNRGIIAFEVVSTPVHALGVGSFIVFRLKVECEAA
jgi:hypothetical protein